MPDPETDQQTPPDEQQTTPPDPSQDAPDPSPAPRGRAASAAKATTLTAEQNVALTYAEALAIPADDWSTVKRGVMPRVGDRLWYFLGFERHGEWIRAVAVNRDTYGFALEPPRDEDGLHLMVFLDRGRHNAARSTGNRLDVKPGLSLGQWQQVRPAGADEAFRLGMEQKAMAEHISRNAASNSRRAL